MRNIKTSVAVAALGTLIEYYDYAIFSLFLPFFAPVFFPAQLEYASLVMGFYALLITSIARPLGGLLFGAIGDKFGRKTALIISLYGIAFATLTIGFLPGYAQIGVSAMILLTLIRALQMLCYGGEYSGAGIYVVELASKQRSGLVGAVLAAMALLGSVIASLVGLSITWFDKVHPNWRLAFIIGGVIGLVAIYFRRLMRDSVEHEQLTHRQPLLQIFRQYPRAIFAGMCIGGSATLLFTTVLTFINPILKIRGFLDSFEFMFLQFLLSSVAVITLIVSGLLADKLSSLRVMRLATWAVIILALPLCLMLESTTTLVIVAAELIMIILNELLLGPSNAFLKGLFPASCRYRGVAFSFCFGLSLISGLTPLVENYLYHATGRMFSIAAWLIFVSIITLISLRLVKNQKLQ